ncbi:MAG: flavodoxin domain-containing protein, partial [Thermoleophilia bacterium]|nr:flavodoxin domain-containing protein [Thermoleophilia bacterium]
RYGSTREVADRVGATLRDGGLTVDVQPVENVRDLSQYAGVVLGTAYYFGKMLKTGAAFLERHRGALENMPVAFFALGPTTAADDLAEARGQMDRTLAELGWLEPVAKEMFVGKYDPAVLHGLDKLVTKLKASPLYGLGAHDDRDWDAIENWAMAVAAANPFYAEELFRETARGITGA